MTGLFCHPLEPVIAGQAQFVAAGGFNAQQLLHAGRPETVADSGVLFTVNNSLEAGSDKVPHLARTLRSHHPGVSRNARVGRHDRTVDLGQRIVRIDGVDEDDAGLTGLPGVPGDLIQHLTFTAALLLVSTAHELVTYEHRDVEGTDVALGGFTLKVLAGDEVNQVSVGGTERSHSGTTAGVVSHDSATQA